MVSEKRKSIINEFLTNGYTLSNLKECYHESKDETNYIFQKLESDGALHEIILEDHTRDDDILDWLIFSYAKDQIIDYFGKYEDAQYPLIRNEYKLIEKLICCIEEEKENENQTL